MHRVLLKIVVSLKFEIHLFKYAIMHKQFLAPRSIGNQEISVPLALAPMSGVTGHSFRELLHIYNPKAIGLTVTEFISIEAITRLNPKCFQMLRYSERQRVFSVQIFGHEIERMVDAALIAQDAGANIVDINSGCPAPKVVKKGGGCELMRQPQHLEKILNKVRSKLSIPLTLKIRAGWDQESRNAIEIAKIAEGSGVSMLAVHGRTKAEGYRGDADWDVIETIAKSLSIPVYGSGDVVDFASAKQRLTSDISGLMIGRAALLKPWVFSEIRAKTLGEPFTSPPPEYSLQVMRDYRDLLLTEMSSKGAIGKLKQLASQISRGLPKSKPIRQALCRSRSIQEFSDLINRWEEFIIEPDSKYSKLFATEILGRTTNLHSVGT